MKFPLIALAFISAVLLPDFWLLVPGFSTALRTFFAQPIVWMIAAFVIAILFERWSLRRAK